MAQQVIAGITEKFQLLSQKLNEFSSFVADKLKNFPRISLGEKISYVAVGVGFLFILISVVLFII